MTSGRARVAIVVPCYNHGLFLPEAIGSVLAQTYSQLEAIVVDDGSTDDSAEVAEALVRESGGRVRLLRKENGGLPSARNAGVAAAGAEYVLPLDADDRLAADFVERCVAALDARPDASIAYGDQQNFGEDTTFHPHPDYDFWSLTRRNHIGVASLFRRRAWEEVGGYAPLDSYEDWDFWIACGERGHAGLHVPGAVFHYRVRAGSMFDEATKRDQRLKAQIVLNHPGLYATAEVEWAAGVLAREPAALAVDGPLGVVPRLGGNPPRWSGERLADARGHVILVLADELVAEPALGAAVRTGIRADEDVTVVLVDGVDGQGVPVPGLERALAAYDLAGDETPDLLATCERPALLAQHADAILTQRTPPIVFSGLRRLDPAGLAAARPARAAA